MISVDFQVLAFGGYYRSFAKEHVISVDEYVASIVFSQNCALYWEGDFSCLFFLLSIVLNIFIKHLKFVLGCTLLVICSMRM